MNLDKKALLKHCAPAAIIVVAMTVASALLLDASALTLVVIAVTGLAAAGSVAWSRLRSHGADPIEDAVDRDVGEFALEFSARSGSNAIATAEVSFSVDRMKTQIQTQVQEVALIAESASAINEAARDTTVLAEQATEAATESRHASDEGEALLAQAISRMRELNEHCRKSAQQVATLSSRSSQIRAIAGLIDEFAMQSKILALNAGIEAVRAGESGTGFEVVANEIKSLAHRTESSVKEVADTVDNLQREIQEVVREIEALAMDADSAASVLDTAGRHFIAIQEQSKAVESQVGDIAASTGQTESNIEIILAAIAKVKADLESSGREIGKLAEQAEHLSASAAKDNARWAELSPDTYHAQFFKVCRHGATRVQDAFLSAIENGVVSIEDMFDDQYVPIPNTNPQKYSTRFDTFTDDVLPSIQEPAMEEVRGTIFAAMVDAQGYVPTANDVYCQPLTGDYDTDVLGNRTKRMYPGLTPPLSEREKRMSIQTYKRDTGEVMHFLAVPVFLNERYWGSFIVGYRPQISASG